MATLAEVPPALVDHDDPRTSASPLLAQLRRDALLAVRARSETANPLAFFALGVLLLSLGTAEQASGGGVWVLALFANVLAADGMFSRDADDGTLEQMLIHRGALFTAVFGKLAVYWLYVGVPLAAMSPLALLALQGSFAGAGYLAASLLLGTPTLACIGAFGAALTVGTGRSGLLLAILAMPLYVPVLIFGVGASRAAVGGAANDDASLPLLMLAALLVATITATPFVVGRALAISQEY